MEYRSLFKFIILFIGGITCVTCISQDVSDIYKNYDRTIIPYLIYNPSVSYELDKDLKEISGLTWVPGGLLAAVEDEHGRIYHITPETGKILSEINFKKNGDFEAIEWFEGIYYAMESNGDLYAVKVRDGEAVEVDEYETGFRKDNDVEGLGLLDSSLLAACKGKGEVNDNDRKGRNAYKLDDNFKVIAKDPYEIDEDDIEELIGERIDDIRVNEFDPSGIAVELSTGHIWVLSADYMLAVLDNEGKLIEVVLLDRKIFRQPEAICFSPDGDLFIASEADGKSPMLFKFERLR